MQGLYSALLYCALARDSAGEHEDCLELRELATSQLEASATTNYSNVLTF